MTYYPIELSRKPFSPDYQQHILMHLISMVLPTHCATCSTLAPGVLLEHFKVMETLLCSSASFSSLYNQERDTSFKAHNWNISTVLAWESSIGRWDQIYWFSTLDATKEVTFTLNKKRGFSVFAWVGLWVWKRCGLISADILHKVWWGWIKSFPAFSAW